MREPANPSTREGDNELRSMLSSALIVMSFAVLLTK